jgi:hypothetical protein
MRAKTMVLILIGALALSGCSGSLGQEKEEPEQVIEESSQSNSNGTRREEKTIDTENDGGAADGSKMPITDDDGYKYSTMELDETRDKKTHEARLSAINQFLKGESSGILQTTEEPAIESKYRYLGPSEIKVTVNVPSLGVADIHWYEDERRAFDIFFEEENATDENTFGMQAFSDTDIFIRTPNVYIHIAEAVNPNFDTVREVYNAASSLEEIIDESTAINGWYIDMMETKEELWEEGKNFSAVVQNFLSDHYKLEESEDLTIYPYYVFGGGTRITATAWMPDGSAVDVTWYSYKDDIEPIENYLRDSWEAVEQGEIRGGKYIIQADEDGAQNLAIVVDNVGVEVENVEDAKKILLEGELLIGLINSINGAMSKYTGPPEPRPNIEEWVPSYSYSTEDPAVDVMILTITDIYTRLNNEIPVNEYENVVEAWYTDGGFLVNFFIQKGVEVYREYYLESEVVRAKYNEYINQLSDIIEVRQWKKGKADGEEIRVRLNSENNTILRVIGQIDESSNALKFIESIK